MVYNNLGTSGGATKLFLRVSPNGLLIHTAGEGVNSTIIQCVHEQSLTGICIFPVFYLLPIDHLCTNR